MPRRRLRFGLVDAVADDPLAAALERDLVSADALSFMQCPLPFLPGDQKLVQIVDAALADTERRSGDWLICKPGCTPCCIGVFAIDQLDVLRLHEGLAELDATDPDRAARVRQRARDSIARFTQISRRSGRPAFWARRRGGRAIRRIRQLRALSGARSLTGACDVYAARPMTCRVFGPPVRSEGGLGVCELCYHGASAEEIAACEMNGRSREPASGVARWTGTEHRQARPNHRGVCAGTGVSVVVGQLIVFPGRIRCQAD